MPYLKNLSRDTQISISAIGDIRVAASVENDDIWLNEMMVLEVARLSETKGGDTMGIIRVKLFHHRP